MGNTALLIRKRYSRLCWPAGRDKAVSIAYDGSGGDKRDSNSSQAVGLKLVSSVQNRSSGRVVKSRKMDQGLYDVGNIFPVEVKSPDFEFFVSVKDTEGRASTSFCLN